jgi:hypothetical protein
LTLADPLPSVATVSLRVAQSIASLKPFVADFNVPEAVIHQKTELTFKSQSVMEKRSFRYQACCRRPNTDPLGGCVKLGLIYAAPPLAQYPIGADTFLATKLSQRGADSGQH